MAGIHGGDIYRNQVILDFSVNINPLGVPEKVGQALHHAVERVFTYPDIEAEKLRQRVGVMLLVPEEYLLFGNGASELFMAIVHGIQPEKTVIPVPSFYGYEYVANAFSGEVSYYPMKEEEKLRLTEEFFQVLTEDVDLVFLANPNNPTGSLMDRKFLGKLLKHCQRRKIYVVLDECFIGFCEEGASMLPEVDTYENLILVQAFTKLFSIPGVRLGYLVCSNPQLREKIGRQLPEWNLSSFAQAAGCACTEETLWIEKTVSLVEEERAFLTEHLREMGFEVLESKANFILFRGEPSLGERLLRQGILIRNCENFRGLSKGYYRICVKSRKENERLLKAIGERN